MTAEITIMNKTAIALAADSAVTIGSKNGQKIYNSVDKLFTLSKYHPVGVMVYGSAELMDIPWEIIIKNYRRKIGKREYPTIRDYAEDFLHFIANRNPLFPVESQNNYFLYAVGGYYKDVVRKKNQ